MAKVLIPRNIEKGIFSMNFQLGPFTVSIIQLFLLAGGVGLGLGVFNLFAKQANGQLIGGVLGVGIFLLFVFIAFFSVSELSLIPFIAKLIRTNFIDTPKKFQVPYEKLNPTEIAIRQSHTALDSTQKIEQKQEGVSDELLKKFEKDVF